MIIKDLTIVIPVLNESVLTMSHILHNINNYLSGAQVIFVDDHSNNAYTLKGLTDLQKEPNVLVIKNNGHGQETALYTGIMNSNTDYIACLDCDEQDPVSALSMMYKKIKTNNLYAIAGIRKTRNDSIFRIISANIYHYLFQKILGKKVPAISNFFIIYKDLKPKINPKYVRGIIYIATNSDYMYYKRKSRKSGKSKFTLIKLLKVANDGFKFAKAGERNL